MRGRIARNKFLRYKLFKQSDELYQYYSRLDRVMKTAFQRKLRRVWFAYKERRDQERKRKAAIAAKKRKGFKTSGKGRAGPPMKKEFGINKQPTQATPSTSPQKVEREASKNEQDKRVGDPIQRANTENIVL